MRSSKFDVSTATSVAALALVLGLVVPVVSAPGSVGLTAPPSERSGSITEPTTGLVPIPQSELQVTPAPQPTPTDFTPVVEPSAEATAEAAAPSAPPSTTSISSASTSRLPAASAPEQPLAAQPAPIEWPVAQPACPAAISGATPGAPSRASALGVAGTTSDDLQSFAQQYNAIRVANCLPPVPFGNIRYDSCMEDRLFWMAEDPSTDPMSAWGHIGSQRSDGVPSVGCDGNLAGGSGNTGADVAQKWWDSNSHRASLYKPTYTGSTAGVCILFAMTHGGVPNEPHSFTRAAARWVTC